VAGAMPGQNPNSLGCLEDLRAIVGLGHDGGALLIVAINEPLSLGLLHGPGHYGADLAVGEAHALGTPLSFGGPFLGFMAAKESLLRQMPGRLGGEAGHPPGPAGSVPTRATPAPALR